MRSHGLQTFCTREEGAKARLVGFGTARDVDLDLQGCLVVKMRRRSKGSALTYTFDVLLICCALSIDST